ncbi:MAG: carbohydrate binding domain-containing protein [Pyrinomonadaceae bacterium]
MPDQQFIVLARTSSRGKAIAASGVLATLVFAFYAISWQTGNMLAELTLPSQPDARDVSNLAVKLAPSDPSTRWLAAANEKETFTPESIETSTRLFEDVVRRAPNDYRYWIELGRADEQAERADSAELAFRRAVDLAPDYTFPHWQFGNFYLRQNRTEEAFAELKRATERSLVYRDQVFALAWDYFGKDASKVESLAADTPDVRASLALFYAVRSSPADSLRIWNLLSPEDKAEHPQIATTIAKGLNDKRFYRQALEFSKQSGLDPDAAAETVTNAGFETFVGSDESLFGWKVLRNDGRLDIATDSVVKHSGARSIRFVFRGYSKPALFNLGQIVVVEPKQRYRLSFWVRTENLRSGGQPLLQVASANDDAVLGASQPFFSGTSDWQQISIDFTAPENCEGITIRTTRGYCGDECPIIGTLWYDDFTLARQ